MSCPWGIAPCPPTNNLAPLDVVSLPPIGDEADGEEMSKHQLLVLLAWAKAAAASEKPPGSKEPTEATEAALPREMLGSCNNTKRLAPTPTTSPQRSMQRGGRCKRPIGQQSAPIVQT